jgi:hypothetical protein
VRGDVHVTAAKLDVKKVALQVETGAVGGNPGSKGRKIDIGPYVLPSLVASRLTV